MKGRNSLVTLQRSPLRGLRIQYKPLKVPFILFASVDSCGRSSHPAKLYTYRTCPEHFFGSARTNLGRTAGRDLLLHPTPYTLTPKVAPFGAGFIAGALSRVGQATRRGPSGRQAPFPFFAQTGYEKPSS